MALTIPDDGQDDDAVSTTRVETADGPNVSASLLASDAAIEVDGRLADAGELANTSELSAAPPPPSGGVALSVSDLADVEPPAGPTTTVWTEPTLPPASEWIDAGNGVAVPDLLLRIRFCESTNNYQAANGYSTARGAYQFLTGSWEWYGHAERYGTPQAHLATPAQQDEAALLTLQDEGTGPWSESRPCWSDPDIDPRYATARPAAPAPPASTTTTEASSTTDDTGSTTTADPGSTTTAAPSSTTDATSTTAPASTTTTPASTTTTTTPSTTTSDPSSSSSSS